MTDPRDEWHALEPDLSRFLRGECKSPSTLRIYTTAVQQLASLLAERGELPAPTEVQQRDVETFMAHLADTRSPGTASVTYRALQQWFGWLVREGEIETSPMSRMRAPKVPEVPVPVLSNDQLGALLKTVGRGAAVGDPRAARAPVPAHDGAPLACGRRRGRRADAARGLALPADVAPVQRFRCG